MLDFGDTGHPSHRDDAHKKEEVPEGISGIFATADDHGQILEPSRVL